MTQPNILILMVDQLNGTLFPDGPADWLHAPNLKRLAVPAPDPPRKEVLDRTQLRLLGSCRRVKCHQASAKFVRQLRHFSETVGNSTDDSTSDIDETITTFFLDRKVSTDVKIDQINGINFVSTEDLHGPCDIDVRNTDQFLTTVLTNNIKVTGNHTGGPCKCDKLLHSVDRGSVQSGHNNSSGH